MFYFFIDRNCVINSKSTIDDVQIILKLLNENESLAKNQISKTTVLIVVNEIMNIISDNDAALTNDVPEGFYQNCIFLFIF